MLKQMLVLAGGLALTANLASAGTADRKDLQVANDVEKAVGHYVYFTVFDDVNAQVKDGVVTLDGRVTMPYKRDDIVKRVAKVDGVRAVHDRIGVLPTSQFDDQLRARIARAIYGNDSFAHFATWSNPPIHIVVENGRVTLTGVVDSEVERALARSLATQFGVFKVTNQLKTVDEVRHAVENHS